MTDNGWLDVELFSVAGGKFHKPAGPMHKSIAWCPSRTLCGVTVTPVNYFATAVDAERHTGGRLSMFACKRCAALET